MNTTHTTPKHTPGPWEIDAAGDIRSGVDIVAIIPSRNDSHSQIAERDANARLIAAAPELLEHLTREASASCATCAADGCGEDGKPDPCKGCEVLPHWELIHQINGVTP